MKVKGANVLITGSAVRLGMLMARHISVKGANVIIHYNKSEMEALKLRDDLAGNARVIQGNLSTDKGVKAFLDLCSKECSNVDVLINSASDFRPSALINYDVSSMVPSIVLNGLAPHAIAVWLYKNAGLKKVVNILDASPQIYANEKYGYYLGKVVLKYVTERLALALAPGVSVNAIAPGYILPPAGGGASALINHVPLKRRGKASELNMALDFLIKDDYITGQIIYVDGGAHLSYELDR